MQGFFLASWALGISQERLAPYRNGTRNDHDAFLRYVWNIKLCESFYPSLHALEIVLRNRINSALVNHFRKGGWFNDYGIFHSTQIKQINSAKLKLRQQGKAQTSSGIVAELNFGFWSVLLYPHYHNTLVPPLMNNAYSDVSIDYKDRGFINTSLDEIRNFRNRVFHHEPIWADWQKMTRIHNLISQFILWLNPEMFRTVYAMDRFEEVYQQGSSAYSKRCPALALSRQVKAAGPYGAIDMP